MRLRKMIGVLLVTALATLAFAMTANADDPAAVGAFTGPGDSYKIDPSLDPQTTNVPYLAWVGETVKISKCFFTKQHPDLLQKPGPIDELMTSRGFFDITGWSGVDENFGGPAFTGYDNGAGVEPTREDFGHTRIDRTCFSVVIKSDKPGLAPVDLEVWQGTTADNHDIRRDKGGATLVAQHRFLVIFLQSVKPTIVEQPSTAQGAGGVGDVVAADGSSTFTPAVGQNLDETYGLVKINIKGTFPLGANWASLGKATVTLPDDWAWLASHFASDKTNNAPGSTPWRWDIHDDQSTGDGLFGIGGLLTDPFHPNMGLSPVLGANANKLPDHNVDSFCLNKWFGTTAGTNLTNDAVDNCLGGLPFGDLADYGPFSNINGGHVAIGPFDQLRPFTSVFSDGNLNQWDAPMPALQVNVKLASGDVGSLESADKSDVYLENSALESAYPHNLFAPFYKAYIPAVGVSGNTDPNIAANYGAFSEGRSGVYGKYENNVPGFIWPEYTGFFMGHNNEGVYDYWHAYSLGYRDGDNACYDTLGDPYPLPTGNNKVAVYTDEHGEAYVRYYPYTGLTLSPDGNNRCDLASTNGLYGTGHITATSVYPEKWPTWDAESKDSNTLVKTSRHLASKTLKCIAKGTNEGFCVETILGFNGAPIEGAKVKFTTSGDAANMDPDSVLFGGFDTRGQVIWDNPDNDDYVVLKTNSEGQAGIVITHSQNVCIDVTTENLGTRFKNRETGEYNPGVKRFYEFNPHTGAACGTSTGNGPTTDPGTGTGTLPEPKPSSPAAASTPAVVVSLGGPVVQATPVLQAGSKPIVVSNNATKLFSVKVLQTKAGRYLVVNVKASKAIKKAKVRFAIMGKNGKVIKTFVRTVPTNKAFKIANLKLAKTAVSVRASIVA
jgi:hypothetical protein